MVKYLALILLAAGCVTAQTATPTVTATLTVTHTPTETASPTSTDTPEPTPTQEVTCVRGSWFTAMEDVTIYGIDLGGLPRQQSAMFDAGTKFLFVYNAVSPSLDGGILVVTAEGQRVEGWLALDLVPAECRPEGW